MDYKSFIDKKIGEIKDLIGDQTVVSALSGGVDSSTVTVLSYRAVGNQLKSYFINDGLMRENEGENVDRTFASLGIYINLVDARDRFFKALKGIENPEEKRKAFRETFYRTLGEIVKENNARYLLQGTIKADIIETQKGIKTQHNVLEQIGIDPRSFQLEIIEPLKDLYKNEVREVAVELGLPREIYERQPFPGPGLATRVIGEVTPERVEIVRKATTIVEQELFELEPFQCFPVLMNDKATGLKEGERAFGNIIIVRSVESVDAMTAEPTEVPWDTLRKIGQRITEELPSVVRVAYEITGKPPGTIEYI